MLCLLVVAGCGGGRITLGEVCGQVGGSYCDRRISCQLSTQAERKLCVDAFQLGCCEQAERCGEEAPTKEDETLAKQFVSACKGALPTFECAQLEAGSLPLACTM
jgi:hypothetical protein